MKLSKTSHKNGNTYIVLRSNDNKEYITISISGNYTVSMNDNGDALNIVSNGGG